MWRTYCCLTSFFPTVNTCLSCEDIAGQSCAMEPRWRFFASCVSLCTIVAHNIAQSRPDNFPSYLPDNHHCSDDVYLREGGNCSGTEVFGVKCHRLLTSFLSPNQTPKGTQSTRSNQRRSSTVLILYYAIAGFLREGWCSLYASPSRRRCEMYAGQCHARLCVSVYLSIAACPHYCTDANVTWRMVGGAPLLCTTGWICDQCTGFVAMPK